MLSNKEKDMLGEIKQSCFTLPDPLLPREYAERFNSYPAGSKLYLTEVKVFAGYVAMPHPKGPPTEYVFQKQRRELIEAFKPEAAPIYEALHIAIGMEPSSQTDRLVTLLEEFIASGEI